MITTDNRKEIATAVAKCIAFKNVGNDKEANSWAKLLVELLECHEILKP